ncbi:F-box domain-containing protein [Heracleum sosnowskyi]|uniref:F-box domain-containing protein n=1 Tax=Heracleum sosnowskyi TaxID=360622 RepID=A0AAD8I3D8_9APIA|nr:F-box domain-containing protein [Heracleum sosnowskyi]
MDEDEASMSCSGIPYVTDDLLNEILLRLPVKSLLRFKAVSKPWCSLISSPTFVISHYSLTMKMPGANQTLIGQNQICNNNTPFSLLHLGRFVVDHLESPFPRHDVLTFYNSFGIIGCVKGIVCFSVAKHDDIHERFTHIYLWNPAIKRSKLIFPDNIYSNRRNWRDYEIYPTRRLVALGFGFDPIENDFKVVRVVRTFALYYDVEVYSLNMNVWRKIRPKPMTDSLSEYCVCVNGFLCWTGDNSVVAFDLNREVFNCGTMFPDGLSNNLSNNYCVIDFNNSIALIKDTGLNGDIMLWTLDNVECLGGDGGVAACWNLVLSINKADLPLPYVHSYFNNGDILLDNLYEWFLYNLDSKEAKEIPASISFLPGRIFNGDFLPKCDDGKWFSYDSDKNEAKELPVLIYWNNSFKYKETLASSDYWIQARVVHRDLKPENFLFSSRNEDADMKFIDFDLSDFIRPEGGTAL